MSDTTPIPNIPGRPWDSFRALVRVLLHPNFYWGALPGYATCKYLHIKMDTRDCAVAVYDRNNREVTLQELEAALQKPTMAGMNANPPLVLVEDPAPKLAALEQLLKRALPFAECNCPEDPRTGRVTYHSNCHRALRPILDEALTLLRPAAPSDT